MSGAGIPQPRTEGLEGRPETRPLSPTETPQIHYKQPGRKDAVLRSRFILAQSPEDVQHSPNVDRRLRTMFSAAMADVRLGEVLAAEMLLRSVVCVACSANASFLRSVWKLLNSNTKAWLLVVFADAAQAPC